MYNPREIEYVAEADLPTDYGRFQIVGYREKRTGEEFVVLMKGPLDPATPTLVLN